MILHPSWTGHLRYGFDIALAELTEAVPDVILPMLPDKRQVLEPHNHAYTIGWGHHAQQDESRITPETEQVLRVADALQVVDRKFCPLTYDLKLNEHMVCIYSKDQRACKG